MSVHPTHLETLRAELEAGSPLRTLHRRGADGFWSPRFGGKQALSVQLDRAVVISEDPVLHLRGQHVLRTLREWLCDGGAKVSDLTLDGADAILKSSARRGEISIREPKCTYLPALAPSGVSRRVAPSP